jgi:hypothetical protein
MHEIARPPRHSARIVDAALVGLLIVRLPVPGLQLPTAQLAVIGLLVVALFRRPTRPFGAVRWFPVLGTALLGYAVFVSSVNDVPFARRAANIAVLLTMAAFMTSGRIDVPSALKGLVAALTLNAVLFYVGMAPDHYEGRLTGFIEDKNAAGLLYAVVPLVASILATRPWHRVALLAVGGAGVFLTDSRTSIAAYAVAVAWFVLSRNLGRAMRTGVGVALFLAFRWADSNLAEIGHYASDRSGSDALRARIDAAASLKAQGAPWYGRGLGEAVVNLDGANWFFHNSYEALRVEGGFVLMAGILLLYAAGGALAQRRRWAGSDPARAVSAATFVILLCATRLGEVFFAPIGLFVVGVGFAVLSGSALPTGPARVDPRVGDGRALRAG